MLSSEAGMIQWNSLVSLALLDLRIYILNFSPQLALPPINSLPECLAESLPLDRQGGPYF